jgi:hypothetical protein
MIIDVHGHASAPAQLCACKAALLAAREDNARKQYKLDKLLARWCGAGMLAL